MDSLKRFVIQIVDNKNPLRIRIPVTPGISQSGTQRVITIDSATFYVQEDLVLPVTNYNTVTPNGDLVQLLFSNGFGTYNQEGKMTKVLQMMDSTLQQRTVTFNNGGVPQRIQQRKKWHLIGSPDDFTWTQGHDLELGFTDINDSPIDFINKLQTYYTVTMQINMS